MRLLDYFQAFQLFFKYNFTSTKKNKNGSRFLCEMSPEIRFRVIYIHIFLPKGDSKKIFNMIINSVLINQFNTFTGLVELIFPSQRLFYPNKRISYFFPLRCFLRLMNLMPMSFKFRNLMSMNFKLINLMLMNFKLINLKLVVLLVPCILFYAFLYL